MNANDTPFQDLAIVLEEALCVASPSDPDDSCIAERLQTKYDSTTKDPILPWSMHQLNPISKEFTEDLSNDFDVLQQREAAGERETSGSWQE